MRNELLASLVITAWMNSRCFNHAPSAPPGSVTSRAYVPMRGAAHPLEPARQPSCGYRSSVGPPPRPDRGCGRERALIVPTDNLAHARVIAGFRRPLGRLVSAGFWLGTGRWV